MHRDAGDFDGRVDVAAYFNAGASNADDVGVCARERLNRGIVSQSRVHCAAQHLECRDSVYKCVGNAQTGDRSGREDLRGAFAC